MSIHKIMSIWAYVVVNQICEILQIYNGVILAGRSLSCLYHIRNLMEFCMLLVCDLSTVTNHLNVLIKGLNARAQILFYVGHFTHPSACLYRPDSFNLSCTCSILNLFSVNDKVLTYLRSPNWDTRIAAGQAVEAIVKNIPEWDPAPRPKQGEH